MSLTSSSALSIPEVLSYGWQQTKKELPFLVSLVAIVSVVLISPSFIAKAVGDANQPAQLLINIISWIIQIIVGYGLITISLKLSDDKKADHADLWSVRFPLVLSYALTSLIVGILVLAGMFFLLIPGLIIAVRLQFAPYLVVDKGLKPLDAITKSWQMTKGHTIQLILLALVLMILLVLSIALLVVPFLVAWPVSLLANVYVYRKLLGHLH